VHLRLEGAGNGGEGEGEDGEAGNGASEVVRGLVLEGGELYSGVIAVKSASPMDALAALRLDPVLYTLRPFRFHNSPIFPSQHFNSPNLTSPPAHPGPLTSPLLTTPPYTSEAQMLQQISLFLQEEGPHHVLVSRFHRFDTKPSWLLCCSDP
jgi:hypothetical protein